MKNVKEVTLTNGLKAFVDANFLSAKITQTGGIKKVAKEKKEKGILF